MDVMDLKNPHKKEEEEKEGKTKKKRIERGEGGKNTGFLKNGRRTKKKNKLVQKKERENILEDERKT